MQEVNELKNYVVQGLETSGVLSQLRAQIRASVFKIIDQQDPVKKQSSLYWENPLCQKIHETPQGVEALELITEFLQFYKMDYTLSVFKHESNLKDQVNRKELAQKLGVNEKGEQLPLLLELLKIDKQDQPQTQNQVGSSGDSKQIEPLKRFNQQDIKIEDENLSLVKSQFDNNSNVELEHNRQILAQTKEKVSEITQELKSGQIGNFTKEPELKQKNKQEVNKQPVVQNLQQSDDYGDEQFEEEVEEDFEQDYEQEDEDQNKDAQITASHDQQQASHSQAFDMSVDSMALENYDYVEDIEPVH